MPALCRRGVFSSLKEIYTLVLSVFPWLVVELWICDQLNGGVFTALSSDPQAGQRDGHNDVSVGAV
jgi:hypothetical protein